MHPYLVRLGPLTIPTYGALMATGFLIAIWLASRKAERRGIDLDRLSTLLLIIVSASIVGSRALHVALNWSAYVGRPWWEVFALWKGGLVFFGGLCLAVPLGYWYTVREGLPLGRTADLLAPSMSIGHAYGRVGCFCYGCCYGAPTDLPWGVAFPFDRTVHRHPTQVYEALAEGAIFLLVTRLDERPHRPGTVFLAYLLLYSFWRFGVEFLRADPRGGDIVAGLSIAQVTALLLASGAAAVLLWVRRRPA